MSGKDRDIGIVPEFFLTKTECFWDHKKIKRETRTKKLYLEKVCGKNVFREKVS